MGWCGYGIYDGDDTQTCHLDFIKWAKIPVDEDIVFDNWIKSGIKTTIPAKYRKLFKKNINFVIKKIPGNKKFNEDTAIEWQMLLSLFLDSNIVPPVNIRKNGIAATEYLLGEHAEEFDKPGIRKRILRNFIKRAEKTKKIK
ncbi:MAG: hypothetical protein AABY32_01110 [Nanoarchaeota archaeon]